MRRVRAACIASALAAGLALAAAAQDPPPLRSLDERRARIFAATCAHCHLRPGIGVPIVGDDEAWAPRRERGLEELLANTVNGLRGMPPLGTCSFCSEEDLRRIVAFMAGLERESGEP